ncbi:MAG: NADH-quinone oxidoreductase subunit C [Mariprofundaceae bacterium]|nr:NADH-quinone oxidoreductase subunit C [Mariprofundaceae bacterium]
MSDLIRLREKFGDAVSQDTSTGMASIHVEATSIQEACFFLRDECEYEQLIDLCGLDLSEYPDHSGERFQIVYHLLSLERNERVRLKVNIADRQMLASIIDVWPAANWYEREAFDMYGIIFSGHPDLRRILTDYGFEGHPLRKDFPLTGRVEMFFDEEQWRCVYKPNKLKNRVLIPKTWPGVDRG